MTTTETSHPSLLKTKRVLDIAPCWAGNPVGFAWVVTEEKEFVAYYDPSRRLIVAERLREADTWTQVPMDEVVELDSHNAIALAVDRAGHLHMSANLHVDPLNYWRTTRPGDASSFERLDRMVGDKEDQTTYPRFLKNDEGALIFYYRDGRSGDGQHIFNIYDETARTWSRLVDKPLLDGQGLMNAYPHGPRRGPDGYYHFIWVWRDYSGAQSDHHLCYARSRDLRAWVDSRDRELSLPITLDTAEIIDDREIYGGLFSPLLGLQFDRRSRPVITYMKFDEDGDSQVYTARLIDGS